MDDNFCKHAMFLPLFIEKWIQMHYRPYKGYNNGTILAKIIIKLIHMVARNNGIL